MNYSAIVIIIKKIINILLNKHAAQKSLIINNINKINLISSVKNIMFLNIKSLAILLLFITLLLFSSKILQMHIIINVIIISF